MQLKVRVAQELEKIRAANGGAITAEAVVEFARDPASALHGEFDWDDSEAAEKWRLNQARNIVRLQVVVLEQGGENVRAYVSLTTDRHCGVGYRSVRDVLDDGLLYAQMLADALVELQAVQRRYRHIKELAAVWSAMNTASGAVSESASRLSA